MPLSGEWIEEVGFAVKGSWIQEADDSRRCYGHPIGICRKSAPLHETNRAFNFGVQELA